MDDLEKVIKGLDSCAKWFGENDDVACDNCPYHPHFSYDDNNCIAKLNNDAIALLKEQEKKRITLHKKHILTWNRNDEFSMRKLYEAICEKLLDEGELFITRTDNHEKVDFVFYVADAEKEMTTEEQRKEEKWE